MNAGEVIKMALIHELTETITGDYPSYLMTTADHESKRLRDAAAVEQLACDFSDCPRLVEALMTHEARKTLESRFVYWLDKIETIFPKYSLADCAHWLASVDEIYKLDDLARSGMNGNLKNAREWHERTRHKLLRAGKMPHRICEDLLKQSLIWLEWLVKTRKNVNITTIISTTK